MEKEEICWLEKETETTTVMSSSSSSSNDNNPSHTSPSSEVEDTETVSTDTAISSKETAKSITALRNRESFVAGKGVPFGRDCEAASLYDAYHRRRYESNVREFILITGPSGSGKTFLADTTLREPATSKKDGYYIYGKFDQLQRPEPFAPFVAAMTEFTSLLTGKHIMQLQKELSNAGRYIDRELLLHMIPALDIVLNEPTNASDNSSRSVGEHTTKEEPHHTITSNGHRQRFLVTFTALLKLICNAGLHVCLFLDDLQWADLGSLELVHMMAVSDHLKGFVVVGACRGNEVSTKDDLSFMLRSLEKDNLITVTQIKLLDFDERGVTAYIASQLELEPHECQALGAMMYSQTQGNILFVKRYIINMFEAGVFAHDGKRYQWDQAELDRKVGILSMVELISIDVKRIHAGREHICKVAACLGSSFDACLLRFVVSEEELGPNTKALVDAGTISIKMGRFLFTHDQLQKACYSLILEDERESFHLELGRELIAKMSEKELDTYMFVVASQIVRGAAAIAQPTERSEMALLCMKACQKAMSLASFGIAAAYVDCGIQILGDGAFRENYNLALTLYNAAAEVAYCNGKNEKMQDRVETVLSNARNHHDKLQAYTTKIVALGTRRRLQDAIDTGFHVLRLLGEPAPKSAKIVRSSYMMMKTKWMLSRTSGSKILQMPALVNQDKIAAMKILDLLFVYVFMGKPEYLPFISCRHVQLTLQYGLSVLSASGFSLYAVFLLAACGDSNNAYKYSCLGMQIIQKYKNKEWAPRVKCSFYGMISIWREPCSSSLQPLKEVYELGQKTGDFEFAAMASFLYGINAEFSGCELSSLFEEMLGFKEMMIIYKQETILTLLIPDLQRIANLLGRSDDPMVLTGEFMNQGNQEHLYGPATHKMASFMIPWSCLRLAMIMADYRRAEMLCGGLRRLKEQQTGLAHAMTVFLESAMALARYRQTKARKWLRVARNGLKQMRLYAKDAPHNFLDRVYFLEAETAAVTGNVSDAITLYRLSANLAQKEGFLGQEAYYYERWAVTLQCALREKEAVCQFKRARDVYEKWGATIAVDRLDLKLLGG